MPECQAMSAVRVRLAASASQHMLFSVENCLIIYWQLPVAQQVLNINKKKIDLQSQHHTYRIRVFFFVENFKLFYGHSVRYEKTRYVFPSAHVHHTEEWPAKKKMPVSIVFSSIPVSSNRFIVANPQHRTTVHCGIRSTTFWTDVLI